MRTLPPASTRSRFAPAALAPMTLALVFGLTVAACDPPPEPAEETTISTQEVLISPELGGGCPVTLCPVGTRCVEIAGYQPGVRCVPDVSVERCGNNVCGAGEYCCNASCGICAPRGGFCTQQVCDATRRVR